MARNRKRAKERRARTPQPASVRAGRTEETDAPEPLEHAAPDVELAEAQLAVGRPDLADAADPSQAAAEGELDFEDERAPVAAPAAERGHPGQRLVNFAQGSWRELQRVQWPDRRQVVQATSVVIGFVIIAGAFLGVADLLAGHLMNYILTGHFK
ncbi:MAG TPA: preprotein translocase subunit SecE [Solirubrobacteraceae bacterium]|nr:preprotein translocase subunit SecE [Solirubrobacteraceae bacterium]